MNYTKQFNIDWITICIYLLITCFGWLSIYSSSYQPEYSLLNLTFNMIAGKQLFFIILSTLIVVLIILIDIKIITRLGYIIYLICVLSLILVLFFGKEVGGAKAWFDFGVFGLQPAEFAKFGAILVIAKFMNDKNIYLTDIKKILKVSSFIVVPILLILQQPDAGSALVYASLIIMFFREGLPLKYIVIITTISITSLSTIILGVNTWVLCLVILTVIFGYILYKNKKTLIPALLFFIINAFITMGINYTYNELLPKHQKERIDLIIGKEKNNLGSGYNLNQSLIAIGSGGLIGKGFLQGTQTKFNFVPEQNTDFIFCTVGEEWGFIGSFFIMLLFILLILRILFLSENQTSRFSRIFGYSLTSILFAHVIINMSMTLGLMPVIGIPLPFFSYGGSSFLSFSILLFTFLKLDQNRTERF